MISRNVSKYLRGLAILIVIASHYSEWMYVEPAFPALKHCISTWGPPGVDIFFLFSGYGLYKSFKAAGEAAEPAGSAKTARDTNGLFPLHLARPIPS